MGLQNLKFETEIFQQVPQFQFPDKTPIETKPDATMLNQIASQIGQLTAIVNQLTQVVAAQTFTRAVPQAGTEAVNAGEDIRKLTQRIDDLEARAPKSQAAGRG